MIDILQRIKKHNAFITLDDEKRSFTIIPSVRNKDPNLDLSLQVNKKKILNALIDVENLLNRVERWADGSATRWNNAYQKFHKTYHPVPYDWDAHDYIIAWLSHNERREKNSAKYIQLSKKQITNQAQMNELKGRLADVSSATAIVKHVKIRLTAELLHDEAILKELTNYMEKQDAKKEKAK